MTDSEIIEMLSDVVQAIDYDIWKETFLGEEEVPEDSGTVQELMGIVKQHMLD